MGRIFKTLALAAGLVAATAAVGRTRTWAASSLRLSSRPMRNWLRSLGGSIPMQRRPRRNAPSEHAKRTNLRAYPSTDWRVVRALPSGSLVYPTGTQEGMWWQVADENDNQGWVRNDLLEPAR